MSHRPLRVLFCQPTAGRSGSEHSLLQMLRALDPSRVCAQVLLGQDGPMAEEYRRYAELVEVVPSRKLRRSPAAALGFGFSFPRVAAKMSTWIQEQAIDAVHVNTLMFPQAVLGARWAGTPVVTHVREVRTTYPKAIYDRYVRFTSRFSTRIILVCDAIRQQPGTARSCFHGARVLYNASDLTPGQPKQLAGSKVRLVSVLPTTRKKGLLDLAEALVHWKRLRPQRPIEWTVVGAHRELDTLDQARSMLREAELESCVHFVGEQSRIRDYLEKAHLLVHPSHTEAFPRVLVEAMNCALPCVATDVGGSREALEEGETGHLVAPRDPLQLAHTLAAIIDQPDTHRRMSLRALERYRELFTPQVLAEGLEAELRKAIDEHANSQLRSAS